MSLLEANLVYKPFQYPWCYDSWLKQQQIHWLPEEVPLGDDVNDWKNKITEGERNLLTQIFRFFTQADIEVQDCYMQKYGNIFKPTEVKMMLTSFSNMETVHIAAYSHLLDTIGMDESEYSAFLSYKEMKDKHEYLQEVKTETKADIARTLATFGAFTEGMQLFASFAILLNFPRFGKMKGMGQIITWSVRDESLHCENIIRLYHTFMKENNLSYAEMERDLVDICREMVKHEDAFIELAFGMGPVEGLNQEEVKQYIRYIANKRLIELKCKPIFNVSENPLPWLDVMLNSVEHTNFFENKATEYSKAATTGEWDFDSLKL